VLFYLRCILSVWEYLVMTWLIHFCVWGCRAVVLFLLFDCSCLSLSKIISVRGCDLLFHCGNYFVLCIGIMTYRCRLISLFDCAVMPSYVDTVFCPLYSGFFCYSRSGVGWLQVMFIRAPIWRVYPFPSIKKVNSALFWQLIEPLRLSIKEISHLLPCVP